MVQPPQGLKPNFHLIPILHVQINAMLKQGQTPWRIVCRPHIYQRLIAEVRLISGINYRTLEKLFIDGQEYRVEEDASCEKDMLVESLPIKSTVTH